MKRLFTTLLLLPFTLIAGAIEPMEYAPFMVQPVAAAPSATYLINQNFEGTGYDNSETWTETLSSGTVDEDYTSTVLVGSQSLQMVTSGFSQQTRSPAFTGKQVIYAYFQIRPVAIPAGGSEGAIFIFQTTAASARLSLRINNNGTLRLAGNVSGTLTTVGAVSAGTTYHVWVSLNTTSSPEACSVGFSTDGVRPTSGNNYVSGTVEATDAASIVSVGLSNGGGGSSPTPQVIFDRVLVDDEQIGNNP